MFEQKEVFFEAFCVPIEDIVDFKGRLQDESLKYNLTKLSPNNSALFQNRFELCSEFTGINFKLNSRYCGAYRLIYSFLFLFFIDLNIMSTLIGIIGSVFQAV